MVAGVTGKSPSYFNLTTLLLLLAFATDVFTPLLIWKEVIPDTIRWASHGAIVLMILLIPIRILVFNKIPAILWLFIFASAIGIITAVSTGQGIAATIWGWWLMFQFPLAGLFSYLQPVWPVNFSGKLINILIFLMGLEVVVQVGQYLTGEVPGDNLAGTFGQNGTGDLVLFLILVLSFTFGDWLINQKWPRLILVIGLGIISSILGEMKLFYFALGALSVLGLAVYIARGKNLWKMIPVVFFLTGAVLCFIPLYDTFVPAARELPLEGYIENPELLTKYLTFVTKTTAGTDYYYDVGRNYAVVYGWNKIKNNPQDLTVGYGIGSRSESRSLGIVGRGLEEGDLGITSGTSLLVFIQETGVFGITIFTVFSIMVIRKLIQQVKSSKDTDSNSIRIGMVFFSLLWPVWLWYNAVWTLRVPMLLYWSLLGYLLSCEEKIEAVHETSLNRSGTDFSRSSILTEEKI